MTQALSVAELVAVARAHWPPALPDEARQSLPVPVRSGGRVRLRFLYAVSVVTPRGVRLVAPSYLSTVDVATGHFVGAEPIAPSSLGSGDREGQFIGTFALPPGLTAQGWRAREAELHRALDVLLPSFAAGERGSPSVRAAAERCRTLFDLLAEPPLRPYYAAIGGDFFRWLDRVQADAP